MGGGNIRANETAEQTGARPAPAPALEDTPPAEGQATSRLAAPRLAHCWLSAQEFVKLPCTSAVFASGWWLGSCAGTCQRVCTEGRAKRRSALGGEAFSSASALRAARQPGASHVCGASPGLSFDIDFGGAVLSLQKEVLDRACLPEVRWGHKRWRPGARREGLDAASGSTELRDGRVRAGHREPPLCLRSVPLVPGSRTCGR